ncbi:exosortase-associated EpsI family protein [Rhodopirellula sp. SWK7]|uniref:exosortase-associated EpsI family protein n=1 Tax=Rhodopirellula sp. SWK7 TaxID=595460 RepID=UPI0002BEE2A0|nr:exosortase-associated EpsI family protein [Rhodopirellula sp. SWK7]EMI44601.1 putative secreted protein [Rhodopirellula sp. SWK7]
MTTSSDHLTVQIPSKPLRRRGGSSRIAATAVLVVLTLMSGAVHGYLDGRWSVNRDLTALGSVLDDLPDEIGEWKLHETQELDPGAAQLLRCYGSVVRVYRNEANGAVVNLAIMFGPRGPIAVHTPEICYSSIGTNQVGEREVERVGGAGEDSLWSVRFAVDPLPDPSLEVWYGWSSGGEWQARENPRFWFTDALYKIQIAGPAGDGVNCPVKDFAASLLPLTHQYLGTE